MAPSPRSSSRPIWSLERRRRERPAGARDHMLPVIYAPPAFSTHVPCAHPAGPGKCLRLTVRATAPEATACSLQGWGSNAVGARAGARPALWHCLYTSKRLPHATGAPSRQRSCRKSEMAWLRHFLRSAPPRCRRFGSRARQRRQATPPAQATSPPPLRLPAGDLAASTCRAPAARRVTTAAGGLWRRVPLNRCSPTGRRAILGSLSRGPPASALPIPPILVHAEASPGAPSPRRPVAPSPRGI